MLEQDGLPTVFLKIVSIGYGYTKLLLRGYYTMNYFITIQPNKYNSSDRDLIINFKRAIQRYYRKTIGRQYHKHKDIQYKLNIDLSHGKDNITTHPHLHIIADIPDNQCYDFIRFVTVYLKKSYPKLSVDCQPLISDLDKLRAGMYSLKQSVRMYDEKDLQTTNYIF